MTSRVLPIPRIRTLFLPTLLIACDCAAPPPATDPQAVFEQAGFEIGETTTAEVDGEVVQVTTVSRADPPDPAADEAACAAGTQDACHRHGQALLYADRAAEAAAIWLELCQQDHAQACADLAYQYANPYVEIPDRDEHALAVGTKACELHAQPISCNLLAAWYEEGKFGAPKDPTRAEELYRMACVDGHYWSCERSKQP